MTADIDGLRYSPDDHEKPVLSRSLSRRDYLDNLKNRAKSGNMAVLELTFKNVSRGNMGKILSTISQHFRQR